MKLVIWVMGLVKRRSLFTRPASGSRCRLRKKMICKNKSEKEGGHGNADDRKGAHGHIKRFALPAGAQHAQGTPIRTARNMPVKSNSSVAGRRSVSSCSTGRLVPMEVPRSPCSNSCM